MSAMARIRGIALHNSREVLPPNADPALGHENVVFAGPKADVVLRDVRQLVPAKDAMGRVTRKSAVRSLEFIVQADKSLSREDQIRFMRDSVEFLKGKGELVQAVGHFDEVSPHLHCVVVPLTKDRRLSAKEILGNTVGYQALQQDFEDQVGKKYGMIREPNSKTKHIDQKGFYADVKAYNKALEYIASADGSKRPYVELSLEERLAKAEKRVMDLLKVEAGLEARDKEVRKDVLNALADTLRDSGYFTKENVRPFFIALEKNSGVKLKNMALKFIEEVEGKRKDRGPEMQM